MTITEIPIIAPPNYFLNCCLQVTPTRSRKNLLQQSIYSTTEDCIRTRIHIKKQRVESPGLMWMTGSCLPCLTTWSMTDSNEEERIPHKKSQIYIMKNITWRNQQCFYYQVLIFCLNCHQHVNFTELNCSQLTFNPYIKPGSCAVPLNLTAHWNADHDCNTFIKTRISNIYDFYLSQFPSGEGDENYLPQTH